MSTLDRLFKPKSFAVVGASNNEDKVGYHLLYALRKFPGKLIPINPKEKEHRKNAMDANYRFERSGS